MPIPVTSINFAWTNKADWTVVVECTDNDTGDAIDFSTADGINVKVVDERGCERLNATLGDGVAVVSAGFQFSFTADQMKALCPGQYRIGGVYDVDGVIYQVFVGTVNIEDGIAEI